MKKVHHEEHVDETWLIPYADMLTLLLALFIVMFAMSKVDQEKFQQLSAQFSVVFGGGSGMLDGVGTAIIPLNNSGSSEGGSDSDSDVNSGGVTKETIENDTMHEIKKFLDSEIKEEGYSERVKVTLNNEGLEISIQDFLLFNSGEAEVLEGVNSLLLQISGMIRNIDNTIKIVGHTDNVPISSAKFRSNWDLSAYRAINVMNYMVEVGKVSSQKFSIQAYGEFSPKFDNSTSEGRAKNRRVEIFIVRKYPISTKTATEKKENVEVAH